MNLADLDDQLPNGFHDSLLKRLELDFESGEARMYLDVCTSSPEEVEKGEPDQWKPAVVNLTDLKYFSIDPTAEGHSFARKGGLMIDSGPGQPSTSVVDLPPEKEGECRYWFFVNHWNSFIRVSAKSASLEWLD